MAEPTIKIKRSSVAGKTPTTSNLALGELGLNTYDGKLFLKQDQGGVGVGTTVITVNPWSVGVGSVAYNTYFTAGNVGIGTTNPTESLSVLNKIQILNDASSNGRLILRGQPGSSYRWNIDNYSSSNLFRIFREDDATSANGSVAVSISTTGTLTATKFSGDGSLITGIVASPTGSDGQVQYNNGGVTGGASALYYDDTNNRVGINTTIPTSLLTVIGSASISGILTVDQLYASNNGNGTNIRIGDDLWLGDINVANTTRLSGAQDSTQAFIVFGSSDAVALGRTGTGPLYYGGNFNVAGIITASSFSGNATSATYATTAGVSTYATTAGVSTYATTAGVSTYATTAGVSTYATTAGVSTYATKAGIATYASTAGVATALQNSRTFEITGDVVASAISFDGTGNVSLAATIQPNSVALGGDTTGDYVQSITGTSNQITVTGGTGEGSTPTLSIPNQFTAPQDVTVTRDLQVNRNLNVTGNITIGGTSATLFTTEFKVYDPDIVLGFRTDANNNDTSTDTTANHGGIAIASTEGTPLVQLFIAGIETTPATYKKIMWFKSGTFSGLGTDAWLINYAVGIGSTQVPNGVRLAAGAVQFTERDLISVRNINASGVVTATTFIGNLTGYASTAGIATYATTAGVSTYATTAGVSTYATTAGVSTYATTAGVSTYATTAGVSTYATTAGVSTYSTTAGVSTYATTAGIATYATTAGVSTYATTAGVSTYATTAGVSTYATTAGVSTSVIGGISSVTQLNVSGVTTTTTLELQSQIVSGYATSTTTATTANQLIFSGLSTVTYRSAEFLIQATEGTNYQVEKLIMTHNGTTTYDSEYANVTSGNLVADYSTDISGGNIRLLVTPASANSTTYKIQYTAIKV